MILLLQSATCDVIATWVVDGDNTQVSDESDAFTDNVGKSNNLDCCTRLSVGMMLINTKNQCIGYKGHLGGQLTTILNTMCCLPGTLCE